MGTSKTLPGLNSNRSAAKRAASDNASQAFDDQGKETSTDFARMLKIVADSGFRVWVGIDFEGGGDSFEGIKSTKKPFERVRQKLSA